MRPADRSTCASHRLLVGCMLAIFTAPPLQAGQADMEVAPARWSIMGGYGASHPGWGETSTRVETIDMVLRRKSVIVDDMGASWYSGYHSLLLEVPLHVLLDGGTMTGMNFLAGYTFTAAKHRPYVFIGGGPVYVDADIPGMGSRWNGNYQIGAGIELPLANDHALLLEARYHHISNGGSEDPNDPLNSAKFLIGYTF